MEVAGGVSGRLMEVLGRLTGLGATDGLLRWLMGVLGELMGSWGG